MAGIDTLYIANEALNVVSSNIDNDSKSFFIEYFSEITSVIEVLLIGAYVIVTLKSFKELKKQTDLQLKAYLNIENYLISDYDMGKDGVDNSELKTEFSSGWKDSMEKAFPELTDVLEGGYYSLELTNYGNTEIKCFTFKTTVIVKNSQESVDVKKLTSSETINADVTYNHILKRGETIVLPLFSTASFPIFEIKTLVSYTDVRGEEYTIDPTKLSDSNSHLN